MLVGMSIRPTNNVWLYSNISSQRPSSTWFTAPKPALPHSTRPERRHSSMPPIHIGHIFAPLFLAPLLPLSLRFRLLFPTSAARPLRPHARRLDLERLTAVELDHVAPLARVLVPVEVGGDATLAVHVRAARAVDLHPLVHEGGNLHVRDRGEGECGSMMSRTSDDGAEHLVASLDRYLLNGLVEVLHVLHRPGVAQLDRPLPVLSCAAPARGHALSVEVHHTECPECVGIFQVQLQIWILADEVFDDLPERVVRRDGVCIQRLVRQWRLEMSLPLTERRAEPLRDGLSLVRKPVESNDGVVHYLSCDRADHIRWDLDGTSLDLDGHHGALGTLGALGALVAAGRCAALAGILEAASVGEHPRQAIVTRFQVIFLIGPLAARAQRRGAGGLTIWLLDSRQPPQSRVDLRVDRPPRRQLLGY
mmetsp:Transcript_34316/g.79329  ORF Transcript_34316/g.79329 Transcript_34316/m.79329 type:complete len:421 (+) Transcript_34316:3-1265(+)